MADVNEMITEYYAALDSADIDRVLSLYDDDSEIVRYDGVAVTDGDRRQYFEDHLARNPGFKLFRLVDVKRADDVLMWDALVDTDDGVLQVFHVVILDGEGRIHRHIPGMRGYWGAGE